MKLPEDSARKLFLWLFLMGLLWQPLFCGEVTLSGVAPGYKNDTIEFYHSPDPITEIPEKTGRCTVDGSGAFSLTFEIDKACRIFADIGIYQAYLFVSPGSEYELKLPPKKQKSLNDILNPWFRPWQVHLGVLNTDSLDLNFLIQAFNQEYQPYLKSRLVSFYNKLEIETIDDFISNTDSVFSGINNKYFNDYKKYKYRELKLLDQANTDPKELYSGFRGEEVLYENVAYTGYFNQVFKNFFSSLARQPEGSKIRRDIEYESSAEALKQSLSDMLFAGDDRLLELVMLKGLYDECYRPDFNRTSLIEIVKEIEHNSVYKLHREIAANILWKITRLDAGKAAPAFALYDQNANIIRPEEFRGKYLYLCFSSFSCYNCLSHYPLLSEIQSAYGDKLSLLTITVDNSYQEMLSKLETGNYSWPFAYYGKQEKLLVEYDVRSFPRYVLIGPDGNLINAYAPSPPEGFKEWFLEILKKTN